MDLVALRATLNDLELEVALTKYALDLRDEQIIREKVTMLLIKAERINRLAQA